MNMDYRKAFASALAIKEEMMQDQGVMQDLQRSIACITDCFRCGGKVFFCGNGGSAADAQHLSAELSGRFYMERPPLAAEALHVNTSFLTAAANDFGYEAVYARMLEAAGSKGDVLLALSTSGKSPNVLSAIQKARQLGISVIGLSGADAGQMAPACDILFKVPSVDTARIQEAHMLLGHIICEAVEKELFAK